MSIYQQMDIAKINLLARQGQVKPGRGDRVHPQKLAASLQRALPGAQVTQENDSSPLTADPHVQVIVPFVALNKGTSEAWDETEKERIRGLCGRLHAEIPGSHFSRYLRNVGLPRELRPNIPSPQMFIDRWGGQARLTVFLEEYDIAGLSDIPPDLFSGWIRRDDGRMFRAYHTGFGSSSLGIHISDKPIQHGSLEALRRQALDEAVSFYRNLKIAGCADPYNQKNLPSDGSVIQVYNDKSFIAKLRKQAAAVADKLQAAVVSSRWGLVYYAVNESWFSGAALRDYFGPMDQAVKSGRLKESITIFDAGCRDWLGASKYQPPSYMNYIPLSFGLPHEIFFKIMALTAGFPVFVTGDHSLGEALSLGIPFIYDDLLWKKQLLPNLYAFARDNLEEASYQRLTSYDVQQSLCAPEEAAAGKNKGFTLSDHDYYKTVGAASNRRCAANRNTNLPKLFFAPPRDAFASLGEAARNKLNLANNLVLALQVRLRQTSPP